MGYRKAQNLIRRLGATIMSKYGGSRGRRGACSRSIFAGIGKAAWQGPGEGARMFGSGDVSSATRGRESGSSVRLAAPAFLNRTCGRVGKRLGNFLGPGEDAEQSSATGLRPQRRAAASSFRPHGGCGSVARGGQDVGGRKGRPQQAEAGRDVDDPLQGGRFELLGKARQHDLGGQFRGQLGALA